jgi:hypothetical protein
VRIDKHKVLLGLSCALPSRLVPLCVFFMIRIEVATIPASNVKRFSAHQRSNKAHQKDSPLLVCSPPLLIAPHDPMNSSKKMSPRNQPNSSNKIGFNCQPLLYPPASTKCARRQIQSPSPPPARSPATPRRSTCPPRGQSQSRHSPTQDRRLHPPPHPY